MTCSKCGLTYAQHLTEKPKHVYQGYVWLTQNGDDKA